MKLSPAGRLDATKRDEGLALFGEGSGCISLLWMLGRLGYPPGLRTPGGTLGLLRESREKRGDRAFAGAEGPAVTTVAEPCCKDEGEVGALRVTAPRATPSRPTP